MCVSVRVCATPLHTDDDDDGGEVEEEEEEVEVEEETENDMFTPALSHIS